MGENTEKAGKTKNNPMFQFPSPAGGSSSTKGFQLRDSDEPGMKLVTVLLNSKNYQSWSRAVRMALGAKRKLELVNLDFVPPTYETSEEHEVWKSADLMFTSWIEVLAGFQYTTNSAKELWAEFEERLGQHNAPMPFRIRKVIFNLKQRDDNVTVYFNKLQSLWDELNYIRPEIGCKCGFTCKCGQNEEEKILKFLFGLNSDYEQISGQILATDPLSN